MVATRLWSSRRCSVRTEQGSYNYRTLELEYYFEIQRISEGVFFVLGEEIDWELLQNPTAADKVAKI